VIVALARHPATSLPAGTCYGRLDVGLAADCWPDFLEALAASGATRVWSSPARRCVEPARATGLPIIIEPRLQELDFGTWEGRRWSDIPRPEFDYWAADLLARAPHGGETGAALIVRVSAAWDAIIAPGKDCAVITHGGPLKVLTALAHARTPDLAAPAPPFGSVNIIQR